MSQRVFSIIARHSNELVSKLRFVPLGLLWGLVAGSLASYRYISSPYRYISSPSGLLRFDVDVSPDWWRLELIFVPIMGAVASSLLIALLLGSALLNRKSSSIRWLVDWVITGAASCAGGAAVFELMLVPAWVDGYLEWMPPRTLYAIPIVIFIVVIYGGARSLAFGILIGIESAAVAVLLAPLALLGHRLILRRASAAEPAGGASQNRF